MTIKAVIFDIGNVLIGWQPEQFFDSVIGEDRRRGFFAAVDLHGMNDRIDAGANFHDTLMQTAKDHSDWADEIHLWHDRWIDMAAPLITPYWAAFWFWMIGHCSCRVKRIMSGCMKSWHGPLHDHIRLYHRGTSQRSHPQGGRVLRSVHP